MCNCPIYIPNPSRRYNLDAPLKIAVPCGHCSACRKLKRHEWFFRSLVEYNYFNRIKGAIYFITLTYRDEDIPVLVLPDGTEVTAFSRSHIRAFVKYIRIWLKRHGYPFEGIKYLICSEYGGHSTKRPHYHGILYLPFVLDYWTDKIPAKERKGHCPFEYFITHCWSHGFVVCSKLGWRINNVKGIQYASKYITKDISYIKRFNLAQYLYNPDYKDWKELNKDYFPKHWQSIGYGEDYLNVIMNERDIPKFLVSNKGAVCGLSHSTVIPRYYHFRLCRSVNRLYSTLLDKTYTELTPIGLEVKRLHLESSINRMQTDLDVIFQTDKDASMPKVADFAPRFAEMLNRSRSLRSLLGFMGNGDDVVFTSETYSQIRELVVNNLDDLIYKCGLYRLSLYRLFLRYMPLFYDEVPEHKFEEISDIIETMCVGRVEPPEFDGVISNCGLSVYGLPVKDNPHLQRVNTCSQHVYFSSYELCCQLLDFYIWCIGVNNDGMQYEEETNNEIVRWCKGSKPHYYTSIV